MNDSFYLEIWREEVAGRMTVYERSSDADFHVLVIEDGRDLLNVHVDDEASFFAAWQDFVSLIAIALPMPPRRTLGLGDSINRH